MPHRLAAVQHASAAARLRCHGRRCLGQTLHLHRGCNGVCVFVCVYKRNHRWRHAAQTATAKAVPGTHYVMDSCSRLCMHAIPGTLYTPNTSHNH
eukprot:scaffold307061_cov21-Tisochrysis_lutea.AAC.2